MASELKPCLLCEGEAKLLRRSGTAGRACPSKWYRERVECKVCGLTTREYKKPGAAAHSWNTRPAPAATDTGLETVAWYHPEAEWESPDREQVLNHCQKEGPQPQALCLRSQAEGLLAAERVDKRIWMEKAAIEAERVERLEAELDFVGRVKGVNEKYANALAFLEMGENDDPEEFAERFWNKFIALEADNAAKDADLDRVLADNRRCLVRITGLEAKLAAAEKSGVRHD
jgi:hypothetical protein